MKAPCMRSEVKKEWVEYMLTEFESRNKPGSKVILESWSIGDACQKGDGYSGDLVKLEAKGTVHCPGDEKHEKEYHHIMKFQSREAMAQEMAKKFGTGGNEAKVYSTIIQELNQFQKSHSDNEFPINIASHVYSKHNDKEYVLVMENMKILGYDNNSKKNMLGIEEAKLALEQLARLHGISYAYNKKHDFLKEFPSYNIEMFKDMQNLGQGGYIDMVIEFLKTQNDHQDLVKKIKAAKPHTLNKMNEAFKDRKNQFYCLNHGDPWNNNILIKQSEEAAKDDKVVFIDWEIAHWNIPAYDLNYFIAGAIIPEMRIHHIDDLLQHYYSHFTRVTTALGSPVPNWGFEQLKVEYEAVLGWGFVKKLTFAMLLSEASKDWKMFDHDVTPNPVSKSIKKGMAKVLVPLLLKPSVFNMMMKGMLKQFTKPVLKELQSKSNYDLNERFLACILEADKSGLFDIPAK
ncbi:unnamed protein product [Meganyctiphanes norvegica]|uniref:CHK kinase-like domain-containing protein n=1 Tax=Meganyctiphanes norvegica TaxID=48144 RepID=A0AAV2RMY6_MEGNR